MVLTSLEASLYLAGCADLMEYLNVSYAVKGKGEDTWVFKRQLHF